MKYTDRLRVECKRRSISYSEARDKLLSNFTIKELETWERIARVQSGLLTSCTGQSRKRTDYAK